MVTGVKHYFWTVWRNSTIYLRKNKRFSVRIVNAPVPYTTHTFIGLEDLHQEIPKEQQEKFLQLLQKFSKIFEQPEKLCKTQTTKHTIVLINLPEKVRIIKSSSSPYNSLIVIVKKKDGKDRFCVDYRKLNSITEDVVTPIPKIRELLEDIGTANIFSTIDLKKGYWQIPMNLACKRYTAFTTPDRGTYQFRVMPFGRKNASSTFQRFMMHEVLPGYVRYFSTVYLDDVIIFS